MTIKFFLYFLKLKLVIFLFFISSSSYYYYKLSLSSLLFISYKYTHSYRYTCGSYIITLSNQLVSIFIITMILYVIRFYLFILFIFVGFVSFGLYHRLSVPMHCMALPLLCVYALRLAPIKKKEKKLFRLHNESIDPKKMTESLINNGNNGVLLEHKICKKRALHISTLRFHTTNNPDTWHIHKHTQIRNVKQTYWSRQTANTNTEGSTCLTVYVCVSCREREMYASGPM